MPFNLPAMVKRTGRRRDVTLRPIIPTQAQATDLATIYAPAWRIWADNIDRILAGYDPQALPTGDALTIDTADQVQTAINGVANEFLTILTARITPALRDWIVRAERVHRDKWTAAVKAGVGVDLEMMLNAGEVQETLSTFMQRNVALVTNVSDQAKGRISDAVFRGYERRAPVAEVAKEIREAANLGRDRSIRIASDQNSKLSSQLDRERQAEAGLTQFKWRSSHKLHARLWHAARDGKVFDSRTGKPVDGGTAIPSDDRAGMQPWCGCREQAYIALLDEVD
ncbi:hypothetical protein [Sphingobium fuliginis]|uniref:Phage head morphogenesis domain-containing protein n=1 Tax=Sphingobium fuliginis ATCC 27551 TaxID=1208342 RepID=A0A5B8CCW0_SPHSA|nr:hypothetical protein [Sphingobium fuliginis]QDC37089.1 hypothetical protein FIL70_07500 [Sphingobium fuliginis ATCC 27551]